MSNGVKYVARSFFWGASSKLLDVFVKFISVPLLLTYFGKDDFGLISLAISVNAYLNLLDLGVNTGAIKYFSEWIHKEDFSTINSVARTSISFYSLIGVINAIVLVIVAFFGTSLFSVTPHQAGVMSDLLLTLSVFAIVNWGTSVFNQLLTANESIFFIHQVNIFKSLFNFLLIYATIQFNFTIQTYFLYYTLINSLVIVPFYIKCKQANLIKNFIPGRDWKKFSIIFKYSMAIIAIGVFQFSATKLRPIVLGIFSTKGVGVITEYRIMETITLFVISIGGMFSSIFLPKTTKLLLQGQQDKIREFAYTATLYTSIICTVLCVPFILCSEEVITMYVGKQYLNLVPWLTIWMFTILFYLHSTPINSIILSTGKTRMLIISTATSCILSLGLNAFLCKFFGVGSAIIGYSLYILIQMSYYYFYFHDKVLHINSMKIFKSFIIPTLYGVVLLYLVRYMGFHSKYSILQIIIKCTVWLILYAISLIVTKTVSLTTLPLFFNKRAQRG